MPAGDERGCPGAEEIRASLVLMAESDAFRGSPQLVAFLRYVVEATLRGTGDRIKGYTIAVEALGRAVDFDPQADPIVRVEAMRLRRALNRYYENGGRHDPVVIDLPLGSYVPVFRRNTPGEVAAQQPIAASAPAVLRRRAYGFASAAALLIAGAAIYAGLDVWFDFNTPNPHAAQSRALDSAARAVSLYPVVYLGAFQATGEAHAAQPAADRLRAKLRDALARFDELAIMSGPPPEGGGRALAVGQTSRYGLTANIEAGETGLIGVAIRLTDVSDGRILFARTFQQAQSADTASAEEAIVREVAVELAQPYGIIYARERALQAGSGTGDPRYRCLLDSYDYWRSYDAGQLVRVRDCLGRAVAADPGFAAGFSALAEIALQEHRLRLDLPPGDAPPLDRALQAARRAVELRPGSARAYQALMDSYFLHGDHALALETGEKAVALNPYNPVILACYGARLVALGHLDEGARYLREASLAGAVRPPWLDFYTFIAVYLLDDQRAAANYASQIPSDRFSLGLMARALVAAKDGKPNLAREYFDRLAERQPRWREDTGRETKQMFPADVVAKRLAGDLAQLSGVRQ